MKNVSLKLPDELHAQLAHVSSELGATKSDVVRAALQAYFAKPQSGGEVSCTELAGNLVGSLTGPADLATNAKHLRGYGR